MSSAARDAVRSRILSQQGKVQLVTLEDGVVVEVRQTTVGSMLDSVSEEDLKKRMFTLLMLSCFIPNTEEMLFEEGDYDSVMLMPSGGYYQMLIDAVNRNSLAAKVEEAKKP